MKGDPKVGVLEDANISENVVLEEDDAMETAAEAGDKEDHKRPLTKKTVDRFMIEIKANEKEHETMMRQVEAMVKAAAPIIVRELPKMGLDAGFGDRLNHLIKASRATPDQRAAAHFYCCYYLKALADDA